MTYPRNLIIETTTRCNLRCEQCARLVDKYALADMSMETFDRLRPLFPHIEEVALYGHGETFLHPQFFTMLEELKKHDIFVYITTNGMLVNERVARRLVELNLDRLSFSLDAATPELFNTIRRGADFQKVLENIRRINTCKQQAGRDDAPVLSIMYCAMKNNIQELPKLVRLADELNMLHGVAVMNIVEYEPVKGASLLHYPDLAQRYFAEAREIAARRAVPLELPLEQFDFSLPTPRIGIGTRLWRNYREFQRSFDKLGVLRTKLTRLPARLMAHGSKQAPENTTAPLSSAASIRIKKCRDPWELLFINVHGEARVCCVSHRIMGNVHDEDVCSIWQNTNYQEFRRRMLTDNPPEECHDCVMRGWESLSPEALEQRRQEWNVTR